MRIPTKVDCGIIALIDIGLRTRTEPIITVMSISKRQGISAKYREQILPLLRHGGIIRSVKGAKGGYTLSRAPKEITLYEVINSLDTTILNDTGSSAEYDEAISDTLNECLWGKLESSLCELTRSITLHDLIERYDGKLSQSAEELMYYI